MDAQPPDVVECAVVDDEAMWSTDSDTESVSFARSDRRPHLTSRPSLLTIALQQENQSVKQEQHLVRETAVTDHGQNHITGRSTLINSVHTIKDGEIDTTMGRRESGPARQSAAAVLTPLTAPETSLCDHREKEDTEAVDKIARDPDHNTSEERASTNTTARDRLVHDQRSMPGAVLTDKEVRAKMLGAELNKGVRKNLLLYRKTIQPAAQKLLSTGAGTTKPLEAPVRYTGGGSIMNAGALIEYVNYHTRGW